MFRAQKVRNQSEKNFKRQVVHCRQIIEGATLREYKFSDSREPLFLKEGAYGRTRRETLVRDNFFHIDTKRKFR
jgi:hypothetical protein